MPDDWLVGLVARGAEVVEVEYSAAAIYVGVHEDDDMLVWGAGKTVMHSVQIQRGEIPFAIEGVEV